MAIKKNLTAMALALSLSLNACVAGDAEGKPKPSEYVEATVLDELEVAAGRSFEYAIKFKTEDNITYFAELSNYGVSSGSLLALDLAIHKGSKIRVKRSALENKEEPKFSPDHIGFLNTGSIYVEKED